MSTSTLIRVHLTIDERWAVGGVARGGDAVDLPILRDERSGGDAFVPHVPGTSLAGSLKRHLGALGTTWMGDDPDEFARRSGTKTELNPSVLRILGCMVAQSVVAVRGSTSVDLQRGAAEQGTLRTEQFAEPSTLIVAMQHDGARNDTLVDALATWAPVVGRGRSVGMGQASVTAVHTMVIDRRQGAQLTWWLTSRSAWLAGQDVATVVDPVVETGRSVPASHPVVGARFVVAEPVHVGALESDTARLPTGANAVATTMRMSGRVGIPGSSWKGIVRHRSETILSMVAVDQAWVGPLVVRLFGSMQTGRGLLRFADSLAAKGAATVTLDHVAIDRFTGGARDGALFSVEAIDRGVELDLAITSSVEVPEAVVGLVRHVIRDLDEGLVGIGKGASRGYGSVALTEQSRAAIIDGLAGLDLEALRSFAESGQPAMGSSTTNGEQAS